MPTKTANDGEVGLVYRQNGKSYAVALTKEQHVQLQLIVPRSSVNPVRKITGEHKQLAKCKRLPKLLGVTDIRNQFGMKALLVLRGCFVYDVSEYPELYKLAK